MNSKIWITKKRFGKSETWSAYTHYFFCGVWLTRPNTFTTKISHFVGQWSYLIITQLLPCKLNLQQLLPPNPNAESHVWVCWLWWHSRKKGKQTTIISLCEISPSTFLKQTCTKSTKLSYSCGIHRKLKKAKKYRIIRKERILCWRRDDNIEATFVKIFAFKFTFRVCCLLSSGEIQKTKEIVQNANICIKWPCLWLLLLGCK